MTTEAQPDLTGEKTTIIVKKIDFKMISFTLAGKDYGVDIMRVKEIRKAGAFTRVPNTPVYVRGVDNLRGDIIPIVDLRMMFNLPAEQHEQGALENIIILRMGELILGIIVDTIEKVVGINRDSIQPPHPIFGDINVKYISGVVENEGRLYIILDMDRIFGCEKEEKPAPLPAAPIEPQALLPKAPEELDLHFLSETLATFVGFYVGPLNLAWVRQRMETWKLERSSRGEDVQFSNKEDAEAFLEGFYSDDNGRLWNWKTALDWVQKLNLGTSGQILVWNPGCGHGAESYSLAALLKTAFPDRPFKIWSNDKDLMGISMAPSQAFPAPQVPQEYLPHMVETRSGWQFNSELKGHIFFEFHDIVHINPYNDLHFIVARDLLSFLKSHEQENLLLEFYEKLRPGAYLLLGKNEKMVQDGSWESVAVEGASLYRKL